jgi:hypothetical protein
MANVYVWGPHLWSILHGVSGLCTPSFYLKTEPRLMEKLSNDYTALNDLFVLLKDLLPCPLCLHSYRDFHAYLETTMNHSTYEEIKSGRAAEYCYALHNLVNDKLFKQRRGEKLNLGCTLDSEKTRDLNAVFLKVQNTPDFLVVKKRFWSSNLHPFDNESVWICLAAFSVVIDKEKSEIDKARRVKSMKDFCGKMSVLLSLGKNYDDLIERMQLLDCRLSSYSINSTDFILNLVCYAKICELNSASESSISKYGPLKDIIINNAAEKETLKIHYLESLLVKKCENTCS